ncbi:MAG: FAD-dependent oxidoreductase [Actinobacteria bacterium]|nr:FAD-dependent oxidoreductase [Actinomycetota bacterium]
MPPDRPGVTLATATISRDRPRRVVVIGAGHAGTAFVDLLLQAGFAGLVVLLGNETSPPYQRPPLSKRLLKADMAQPLHDVDYYRRQGVDLRLGVAAEEIDPYRRVVRGGGEEFPYDRLVIATGAAARRLEIPGSDLPWVHTLRSLADADRLARSLREGGPLAIVGGGWIGLEVASSALEAGIETTVIEREPRLLARVASEPIAEFLARRLQAAGAEVLTGSQVRAIESPRGAPAGSLRLADRMVPAAVAVVGVGARPRVTLALEAGLECRDGIVVDERAQTSDPDILAIGDVTVRTSSGDAGGTRLESIPSATEQAAQAVASILGAGPPAAEVPWFWSEQSSLRIQIAGLARVTDRRIVRQGERADRLVVLHVRDGRIAAVEAINSVADFRAARALIEAAEEVDVDLVADISVPLPGPPATPKPITIPPAPASVPPVDLGDQRPSPGMVGVTYRLADGLEQRVELTPGISLMEGLRRENVPGIVAECGGTCACATCHVLVEPRWLARLEAPYPEEEELLETMPAREESSRLSCQILLGEELDGLVVRLPGGS